jgi:hypothetical protein
VSPEYVRVRGLTVIAGRDFTPGDMSAQGAVIVDSTLARQLWPDGRAVGRRVKLGMGYWQRGRRSYTMPVSGWMTIVGVVAPVVRLNLRDPDGPPVPLFLWVESTELPISGILVRTTGNEAAVASRLTQTFRATLTGDAVWAGFQPWDAEFQNFKRAREFIGRVFFALGLLALALAATGLYAVIAQAVSRRLREFAIRIALGAEARDIARLVGRDAAVMVLAGTAIGGFVTLVTGRYVEGWLFRVNAVDATSLVAAEAILLAAAALACLVPLRRAVRANPLDIIRAT